MTSSLNDVSRTESDKAPLGRLLVDAGVLTLADLEAVLAKQLETGLPLGRMLVDGGYVAAHSVAMALAEQHGGLLKTEYGFATTGRAQTGAVEVGAFEPLVADQSAQRRTVPEVEAAPVSLRLADPPADEPVVQAAVAQAAVVQVEASLARAQSRNEELQARNDELHVRVEELRARNEELQARNAKLQARADELHTSGDQLEARYAELDARFQAVELARAAELAAEVERAIHEAATSRVRAEDRHVLFVPTPGGYVLRERLGPAPAAGAEVVLERAHPSSESGQDVAPPEPERFTVLRVGPSPLPGETHACAYLVRVDT